MLYIITNLVLGEGTKPHKATVKDVRGISTPSTALWPSSWAEIGISAFTEGMQLEGELKIVPKAGKDGKIWENATLYPPFKKAEKSYDTPQAIRPTPIHPAKKSDEQWARENKERQEGQRYGNSVTNAVSLVIARFDLGAKIGEDHMVNDYQLQQELSKWIDFFIKEAKKHESGGAPKHLADGIPF